MLVSFGLTQEYRINVYSQIHEIVFHGKGGYNWTEVYNMPLWLRRFTFKKIEEFYEKEKEEYEKQQNMLNNKGGRKEISKPDISLNKKIDYKTKATKN